MNSSSKNLITILLIATIAYAVYYFYTQNKNSDIGTLPDDVVANTQLFIERSSKLSNIKIDTAIFENQVFRSYRAYTVEPVEEPFGRSNPFISPTLESTDSQ